MTGVLDLFDSPFRTYPVDQKLVRSLASDLQKTSKNIKKHNPKIALLHRVMTLSLTSSDLRCHIQLFDICFGF